MTEPNFPGLIPQDRPSISSSSNQIITSLPPVSSLATPTRVLSVPNPIQRSMEEERTRSIGQTPVETVFTSPMSSSSTSSTRILSFLYFTLSTSTITRRTCADGPDAILIVNHFVFSAAYSARRDTRSCARCAAVESGVK